MNVFWSEYKPKILFFSIILCLFTSASFLPPLIKRPAPDVVLPVIAIEIPKEIERIPDFESILDVQLKKQTFFDYLQPHIDAENDLVSRDRARIQEIYAKTLSSAELGRREIAYISTISETYEVETLDLLSPTHFQQLLRRVDIIPSSLVLAQAANESAWGSSRFAIDGNNFFGQWCYTEGCGLIPSRRGSNAIHEVRSFPSVRDSVNAYFMNLNTFPSYQALRGIRANLREQGKDIDSIAMTSGLESYSERGEDYIYEIQSMIYSNSLIERDQG